MGTPIYKHLYEKFPFYFKIINMDRQKPPTDGSEAENLICAAVSCRCKSSREGDLQIVAAGISVHIQQFSGEVQISALFGFHGLWRALGNRHAACGDDRFLDRAEALGGNREALDNRNQLHALFLGDLVDLLFRRDAAELYNHRDHLSRQQQRQRIAESLVLELLEIPQQTGIQLFLGESRLQVDLHLVAGQVAAHAAAGREHQRTADTEMCEEHLAQLGVGDLAVVFIRNGQYHILEGKPHHIGTVALIGHDGD